ncbi:hypothetical protein [Oceanobacillus bengalensis]|uniref:Uncharacterized protein n=1 Tax=Oceanobacillus bengalensis TaxID=1435466 RepID=A0A494YVA7_9BACI|nr:hypothetical protein [Oceanobacillus bengalensis]RKQ14120.1 hypothetical protein D8M05_13890 [Oceanobacillus bengalensis]
MEIVKFSTSFDGIGIQRPVKWLLNNLERGTAELFENERIIRINSPFSKMYSVCNEKEWRIVMERLNQND